MRHLLKTGRLKEAHSLNITQWTPNILNAWLEYWVGFGQRSQAEALLTAHPTLVNGDSLMVFCREALRLGNYDRLLTLKNQLESRGWMDFKQYAEAIAESSARKNMLEGTAQITSWTNLTRKTMQYLLELFSKSGQESLFNKICQSMLEGGIRWGSEEHARVILGKSCTAGFTTDQMQEVLKKAIGDGVRPDDHLRHAALVALFKMGKYGTVLHMLDMMVRRRIGMEPSLITDLLALAVDDCYDDMIALLVELMRISERADGVEEGFVVPQAYFLHLLRHSFERGLGDAGAKKILDDMHSRGIHPDMSVINELIREALEEMELPRLAYLLNLLGDHHLLPNEFTRSILSSAIYFSIRAEIGNFLVRGAFENIHKDGQRSLMTELPPPGSLYAKDFEWVLETRMRNLHFWKVRKCFEGIFRMPIYVSADLFNELIIQLMQRGKHNDALKVLEEMGKMGIHPNAMTQTLGVKIHLSLGQVSEAKEWLEKTLRYDLHPGLLQTSLILYHLAKYGSVEEAQYWLHRVTSRFCIRPVVSWYGALIWRSYDEHKYDQVQKLYEEATQKQHLKLDAESSNYVLDAYFRQGQLKTGMLYFAESTTKQQRNSHTYGLVLAALASAGAWNEMLAVLEDAIKDPDASIQGHKLDRVFERICKPAHLAEKAVAPAQSHLIVKLMEMLMEGCIPVRSQSCLPYIRHCIEYCLFEPQTLEEKFNCLAAPKFRLKRDEDFKTPRNNYPLDVFARILSQKMLIDMEEHTQAVMDTVKLLLEYYQYHNDTNGLSSFAHFYMQTLPVLRRAWTEVRPEILENLKELEVYRREMRLSDTIMRESELQSLATNIADNDGNESGMNFIEPVINADVFLPDVEQQTSLLIEDAMKEHLATASDDTKTVVQEKDYTDFDEILLNDDQDK